jgi:MFS family permease
MRQHPAVRRGAIKMSEAGKGEFKQGWPVVLSSAIGIGLGLSPLPFYSLGVMVEPLGAEFGWKPSEIFTGLFVMTISVLIAGPVVGTLADRYGARPVALISVLLFGLTFAAFSLNTGDIRVFYGLWAALGIAGAGTLPITWTRGVNSWFVHHRGLALGLALVATGIGGYAATQIVVAMLKTEGGWRSAYVAVAMLPLLIALPIAFLLFREKPRDANSPALSAPTIGYTLGQAAMHWRFWVLAAAFVPISLALGGVIPNMVKILTSDGIAQEQAYFLYSLIPLTVAIGRVFGGMLIDRLWAPGVAFVMLAAPAIGMFELSLAGVADAQLALIGVILIGVALGVEYDFMAYMVARYFGMKSYAAIYGALYGFFALGAAIGPIWYARMFEAAGSYDQALFTGALMTIVGAALLPMLGKYPEFSEAHPMGKEG